MEEKSPVQSGPGKMGARRVLLTFRSLRALIRMEGPLPNRYDDRCRM